MNTSLHNAADQFFGTINGELVCHWSVIQFPLRKGWKRGHRLVVLPDYQGIGVGTIFHNYCAEIIKKEGFKINSTTTTPALINSMVKDKKWALVRKGRVKNTLAKNMGKYYGDSKRENDKALGTSENRITFSFNFK